MPTRPRSRPADQPIAQVLTIPRRGADRGEVRPGAVVPVAAAVAPVLVMGFFLLREEPVTDQTLTEIAGQVMLPPARAPPEAGSPAYRN